MLFKRGHGGAARLDPWHRPCEFRAMIFLSRDVLWLLLAVPASVVVYLLLIRRRTLGLRYASLALVRAALHPAQRWRRHVPPSLFLVALTALLAAAGRPSAVLVGASDQRTIVLA